jgi:hypothetical protein
LQPQLDAVPTRTHTAIAHHRVSSDTSSDSGLVFSWPSASNTICNAQHGGGDDDDDEEEEEDDDDDDDGGGDDDDGDL